MVDLGKRTFFEAGGLLLDKEDLKFSVAAPVSSNEQPPTYVDNRSFLLAADDQGTTSQCAAYSMASVIEVALWKKTREHRTIDPVPIYDEAKRIDGNSEPGTYLDSVVHAAKTLGLISIDARARALRTRNDVKFALREFEVCLLGMKITQGWNNVDARTGFIGPDPQSLGGHAVTACWYDDSPGSSAPGIGIENSWGLSWGVRGFGRMTWEQFDKQFLYGLVVENI